MKTASPNTSDTNNILSLTVDPPQYTGPGDLVRLQCIIPDESQYELKWSRVGSQPLPYGSVQSGGLLTLNRLRPYDSGVYICSAVSLTTGAIESEIETLVNVVQRR